MVNGRLNTVNAMAKGRPQKGGSARLTLPIVATWPEDGRVTLEINGQKVTLRTDDSAIDEFVPPGR